MRERNRPPLHPGRIVREHYLQPLSINVTDLAKTLGVSRKTVSKIVNERGSVTPEMALRLSRAFSTTPDLWLTLQQNYDLWRAVHSSKEWKRVKAISEAHAPLIV